MIFGYQNYSDLLWEKIVLGIDKNILKFEAEGQDLEIVLRSQWKVRTIFGSRMLFFNLLLEVSQIWYIRTIRFQIGKKYWDICRNIFFHLPFTRWESPKSELLSVKNRHYIAYNEKVYTLDINTF